MIEIDGGYQEGGGQILRTVVALSCITRQGVRIHNIRKGREKPGLRPQHLEGISAAGRMCEAELHDLHLNSLEVTFIPRTITGGQYSIDTRTAGSVTLILQTLLPIALHADRACTFVIKGGTAVPFSPTVLYFQHIFCYLLEQLGGSLHLELKRHGFYPAGGGEVLVTVQPAHITSMQWMERGDTYNIEVLSIASTHLQNAHVAKRMIDGFKKIIPDAHSTFEYVAANSPGCFIASHACFAHGRIGADVLGKRGKRAEDVGKEAARDLEREIATGAPIDSWMVDQVVPYMALVVARTGEPARIRIPDMTEHARTNIWVVEKFLPVHFTIDKSVLRCDKKN